MKSKTTLPPLPATTPAELVALRRASAASASGEGDYLAFLARFPAATMAELRKRTGPHGEPFRL